MPKILLVEDDITMVSLLKTLLGMEGYDVSALDSSKDIVPAVLAANPDVLLMDVHLLNHNGIEELKKLRAAPGGKSARVVMTSGLNFMQECLDAGGDVFIQKPFMPDELLQAIRGNGK